MIGVYHTEPRRCSRMNVKVRRLLKGLRYISHAFGEGDQECKKDEIQIGYPTDVKHVAHIGCNGPAATAPTWMKEFKEANGAQVGSSSPQVMKTKSDSKQPQTSRPKDGAKPIKQKPDAVDEVDPTKPQRSRIRRRRRKKKNAETKIKLIAVADDDASLRSCATSPYPTNCTPLADKSSAQGSASDDEASDESFHGTVTGHRFVVED